MRILIFHGYLLRGTGSNVYNASLCRALLALGHEIHLLSQEREASELDFVDAVGRFEDGRLELDTLREPVRCTVYLPDIQGVLPVYVADRYEHFRAVPFRELDDEDLGRYLDANVAAVREVAARAGPEVGLANHLVMGPAILARGLQGQVPYAVKVHGSALEYTVRPQPERFLPYALEGLRDASCVLVGSRHTAESLWEVTGDASLPERTRLGPPGVDVGSFRPRQPEEAAERLSRLADAIESAGAGGWGGEAGAPAALRALDPRREQIVSYVGKLIVSKGVDLLLTAWPLVVARVPAARLVVVGFGEYREGLGRLTRALAEADLGAVAEIAARGRELEGGPPGELGYLASFLESLDGAARESWQAAAPAAAERIHFTGRLEHDQLPDLLPACRAQVVPSTFPEAFGMVAAEAACCGALPLSAAHSGLAEVSAALAPALEPELRPLLAFERGPGAVEDIAAKLVSWLELDHDRRHAAATALAHAARAQFGWERVAEGVVAAAQGRVEELPRP
ncbi:MAG: glycosyltransferase family 4 protein [Thermoleophilaceae bacterium]